MKVLDKVILRTPTSSLDLLNDISRGRIEQLIYDSFFLKAILIASPSLYEAVQRYKKHQLNSKKTKKLFNSIALYAIRMSSRTSPFGLFSGCTVGTKGSGTLIEIDREHIDYVIKPDCILMNQLAHFFLQNERNICHVIYYPNSTLTNHNGKYKYIELKDIYYVHGYKISQIESDNFLPDVLSFSKAGKSFNDIYTYITSFGYDNTEAKDYLSTLIQYQILISEFEHNIVEENIFEKIIDYVPIDEKSTAHVIPNIFELFKQLNRERNRTEEIFNELRTVTTNFDFKHSNPFYAQIIDHTSLVRLDTSIYNSLLEGIQFLMKLLPKTDNKVLDQFKKKFLSRYENQPVPLEEVFDPIIGIGYPDDTFFKKDSTLLDKILIRNKSYSENSFSDIDKILIRKLQEYYQKNQNEIILSDSDLSIDSIQGQYVNSFFALTEIVIVDDKPYIFLKSVAGSSAAGLLSRFGIVDCRIQELVNEILIEEDALLLENQINAEVLSTPPFTASNVISRNHIRDYEILYLANSSKHENQKIPISDLYLKLQNDRFVLYSKKLKKEVKPRLTTAYNFSLSSLPIFRFLSDLQFDGLNSTFNLIKGDCFSQLTYFPRIVYKNCILSLETWRLNVSEIMKIYERGDCPEFYSEIESWRIENQLPERVCMVDGKTNDLVINWKNYINIEILLSENIRKSTLNVQEFLFDRGASPVHDKQGKQYTNEFLFSIIDNND